MLIVVIVFRTIWTFNKFEEIYLLTKGGPGTSTFNLAVYSFEQSIANLRLGVGAATGVVMMVMLSAGQHHLPARLGLRRGREGVMTKHRILDTHPAPRLLRGSQRRDLSRVLPAGLGVSTSLKPKSEIFATPPTLIPHTVTLENYQALSPAGRNTSSRAVKVSAQGPRRPSSSCAGSSTA